MWDAAVIMTDLRDSTSVQSGIVVGYMADTSLLEAALVGYQARLREIDETMTDIRKRLGIRRDGRRVSTLKATPASAPAPRKRRRMSAGARKRIAAAQKKRWAEYRKKQGE
jgi:hypothetical protein